MLNKKNNLKGFTLIEILTVISVITIITVISIPFYHNFSLNANLNSVVRDMTTDIRLTQQLSVTSQINHQLIINKNNSTYSIINKITSEIIKTAEIKTPIYIIAVNSLNNDTIEFNATGASTSEGEIILSNYNRQKTIEIKPSGYVKIQ